MKAELTIDIQELADEVAQKVIREIKPMIKAEKPQENTLLTVKALAEYLHVSDQWVYERIQKAEIPVIKVGKFPLLASGKALALGETDGLVKLVTEAEVGEILGAHMIGAEVTELLGELGMSRLLEGTTAELGWLVHPHPSISETIKEAALAAEDRAIHI